MVSWPLTQADSMSFGTTFVHIIMPASLHIALLLPGRAGACSSSSVRWNDGRAVVVVLCSSGWQQSQRQHSEQHCQPEHSPLHSAQHRARATLCPQSMLKARQQKATCASRRTTHTTDRCDKARRQQRKEHHMHRASAALHTHLPPGGSARLPQTVACRPFPCPPAHQGARSWLQSQSGATCRGSTAQHGTAAPAPAPA